MDLIGERTTTHGEYGRNSFIAVRLQQDTVPQQDETHEMMFGRQMICAKLARIAVGDAYHEDHWRDIAGYATLVADSLKAKE